MYEVLCRERPLRRLAADGVGAEDDGGFAVCLSAFFLDSGAAKALLVVDTGFAFAALASRDCAVLGAADRGFFVGGWPSGPSSADLRFCTETC